MSFLALLLLLILVAAFMVVLSTKLLNAAIALAFMSAGVAVLLYNLQSPIAAVFELSVCAGLVTAIFVSAISLVHPLSYDELKQRRSKRIVKYRILILAVIVLAVLLGRVNISQYLPVSAGTGEGNVFDVMWNSRQTDLLGQIVILLAGVFGIIILFRETKKR